MQNRIDETVRREAQETIWRFNNEAYSDFLDVYDALIGFQPHLSMNREATVLYPFSQQTLVNFNQMIEQAQMQYDNVSNINSRVAFTNDEQKIYKSMELDVKATLQVIISNLALMSDFYDAFISPIMSDAQSRPMSSLCKKTPEMTFLLQSESQNIATTAEQYYELYCTVMQSNIDFYADDAVQKMQDLTFDKASVAAQSLNECLSAVTLAQSSENNIELLLREMGQ